MGKRYTGPIDPFLAAQRGQEAMAEQGDWGAVQWVARSKAKKGKAGLPAEVVIDAATGRAMIVRHGKTHIPPVPRRGGPA